MDTHTQEFTGSCHCGGIGFVYSTKEPPANWNIRACQCTFCRAHAALSTSDPAGHIEFRETVPGSLHRYRFGLRVTEFLICNHCGVYIGAVMTTPNGSFGIINVNALRSVPAGLPPPAPMEYGAETTEERVARREKRWSTCKVE